MKKSESQAIHFHPFSASLEAKRKSISLFVYILAMLKHNLTLQLEKKCGSSVEIGLRTLYQDLVNAPVDADLHQIIRGANQAKNPVLKKIFSEIEARLDQYALQKSVTTNDNDHIKKAKPFQFFTQKPLGTLSENLLNELEQVPETNESDDDKKYTPPELI